jgi:hypothetical protein
MTDNILKKKVSPGDLIAEYDLIKEKFLGKYIVLSMDNYEFKAFCLYDITGFFSQGDIVDIGHDEIVDTERYVWTVISRDNQDVEKES